MSRWKEVTGRAAASWLPHDEGRPPRNWQERWIVWREAAADLPALARQDAIVEEAAGMAFFLLFSLFPALLFLVSLIPHLPVEARVEDLLDASGPLLPEEVDAVLRAEISRFMARPRSGLLTGALLVSLFSASRALVSLSRALNRSLRVPVLRSELGRRLRSVLLTLGLLYGLAAIVVVLTLGGRMAAWLGSHGQAGGTMASFLVALRWPVLLLVGGALVERLYHHLPDRAPPRRVLSVGGVCAILGWGLSTWVFSHLVAGFFHLHLAYGSVGSVIILMAWMFLGCYSLMLGGALNALVDRGLPEDPRRQDDG